MNKTFQQTLSHRKNKINPSFKLLTLYCNTYSSSSDTNQTTQTRPNSHQLFVYGISQGFPVSCRPYSWITVTRRLSPGHTGSTCATVTHEKKRQSCLNRTSYKHPGPHVLRCSVSTAWWNHQRHCSLHNPVCLWNPLCYNDKLIYIWEEVWFKKLSELCSLISFYVH